MLEINTPLQCSHSDNRPDKFRSNQRLERAYRPDDIPWGPIRGHAFQSAVYTANMGVFLCLGSACSV